MTPTNAAAFLGWYTARNAVSWRSSILHGMSPVLMARCAFSSDTCHPPPVFCVTCPPLLASRMSPP